MTIGTLAQGSLPALEALAVAWTASTPALGWKQVAGPPR